MAVENLDHSLVEQNVFHRLGIDFIGTILKWAGGGIREVRVCLTHPFQRHVSSKWCGRFFCCAAHNLSVGVMRLFGICLGGGLPLVYDTVHACSSSSFTSPKVIQHFTQSQDHMQSRSRPVLRVYVEGQAEKKQAREAKLNRVCKQVVGEGWNFARGRCLEMEALVELRGFTTFLNTVSLQLTTFTDVSFLELFRTVSTVIFCGHDVFWSRNSCHGDKSPGTQFVQL